MMKLPVPAAWAAGTGTSLSELTAVQSPEPDGGPGQAMAGIETAVEAARRYIIKRPRLTRLLDSANARVLMLVAPAGFGKTTLAREWVADRPHVWYRGTTATADVAALIAGFAEVISEVIPDAGARAVSRMRAAGTPEQDVDILADLFAEDLAEWPEDTWLVFDDYQFAMEAKAPERFVDILVRKAPVRLLLTSRKRPSWASARRLLYGELHELGRNELAMDHGEAAEVLAHRKDAPAAGLVTLAEGWPAVIGLAALAEDFELPEGVLPTSLYDYFAEELYQAASPKVQRGLCRLALAPSLVEGIAEFLLGQDSQEVVSVGLRLGFLGIRAGALDLHPLLRTFLEAKTRETPRITDDARRLSFRLAELSLWDEALILVRAHFTESLFVRVLELGLPTMLSDARTATLARWVNLAESKRLDSPVVDLAEAELAFHHGERRKSKSLALRAARHLEPGHGLLSRAYYIAGTSARLDFLNQEARACYARALDSALTTDAQRDAVYGDLIASLDLNSPFTTDLLARLVDLDDGTAASEVRIALGRLLIGIRHGGLSEVDELIESAEHVVTRLREPHLVSSFYFCDAFFNAILGRYDRALAIAKECERYAHDVRLPFVVLYALYVRAMAELGLRHFGRCKSTLDQVDRRAVALDDIFVQLESRIVRARLLTAQGLASKAVEVLADPPKRFAFDGERGEYLATLGLANACASNYDAALRLAGDAVQFAETVEVQSLSACVTAIVAIGKTSTDASDHAARALSTALTVGGIDSFVTAYRGCPRLLAILSRDPQWREPLIRIVDGAHDWRLAASSGLLESSRPPRRGLPLSVREREVLDLIAQGMTNKEIAKALFISEATAKVHVRHILEKLGTRTRTEAAVRMSELEDL